jgi:hypothetical protein
MPSRRSTSASSSRSDSFSFASSAASGSSSSSTRGRTATARASATRWRWPTGEFGRALVLEPVQSHEVDQLADGTPPLGLVDAANLQPVADVRGDRHLREQRIALEHHPDAALLDGARGTSWSPNTMRRRGRRLRGRRAGRSNVVLPQPTGEQRDDLARLDRQRRRQQAAGAVGMVFAQSTISTAGCVRAAQAGSAVGANGAHPPCRSGSGIALLHVRETRGPARDRLGVMSGSIALLQRRRQRLQRPQHRQDHGQETSV